MSYWDVDRLLSQEEQVKIEFKCAIDGLGFIDSSNKRTKLEKDDVVTLPLWQAVNVMNAIKMQESGEVEMEIPNAVSKRYIEFLMSMEDPLKANLREESPYFH
jgi:hypothetical protein